MASSIPRKPEKGQSLAEKYPEVAKEWHPTKNGELTPKDVFPGSAKKVWWLCKQRHEQQALIYNRSKGSKCPICSKQPKKGQSLAERYPDVAKEWHPTKNGSHTPKDVSYGSGQIVWWKCANGHERKASIVSRTGRGVKTQCRRCWRLPQKGKSLAEHSPDVAKEWHPTKNGSLTPKDISYGSSEKVWWKCKQGHEWQSLISNRTGRRTPCPTCKNPNTGMSLAEAYPDVAKEWHPTKNGGLTPRDVTWGVFKSVWWKCSLAHEWQTHVYYRTRGGSKCPICRWIPLPGQSLADRYPDKAKLWHPTKNGDLTPENVCFNSIKNVWWKCEEGHEWQRSITVTVSAIHAPCRKCDPRWTLNAIRSFIASLADHVHALTPAEIYIICQRNGMLESGGQARAFLKALSTGKLPPEELKKFAEEKPSRVDALIADQPDTDDVVDLDQVDLDTPKITVEAKDALAAADYSASALTDADEDAVRFLVASGTHKLWRHAFVEERLALVQTFAFKGSKYSTRIKRTFLSEYRRAKKLRIPKGYAFKSNGEPTDPNLMQRLVAVQVRDLKRVGNWSGTGAGKTLSAILASRVSNAKLTVICCPNSVVPGWADAIKEAFPDSAVETKTFDLAPSKHRHRYVVLNYEMFQQPDSESRVQEFADLNDVDFVIVDEIHFVKQRAVEDMSKRRKLVADLISQATEKNPDLRVLGMSATPVINNLQEGKSLVEIITGVERPDIETEPTVSNCMKLHQHLSTIGIRWMPQYDLEYEQVNVPVDCTNYLDEIRELQGTKSLLALEQILTRARLDVIRKHVRSKTLIYTHYIQGIDHLLREALTRDGWKVGFFTGDEKTGLDEFIRGDLDVLIGTAAIGTGVDGLQRVCDRVIMNVLPWTAAEFDQLKGRVYRQGHKHEGRGAGKVTLIVPTTYADIGGVHWSWCESKLQRLQFKKSIADAAVDGVVPEGHLRSPEQAYRDIMAWLSRIDAEAAKKEKRP